MQMFKVGLILLGILLALAGTAYFGLRWLIHQLPH